MNSPIFVTDPAAAMDILNGNDAIDLLADLCAHWKRHRNNGITPTSVRSAIVLQAHEISSKNLSLRGMEDRVKSLEDSRVNQSIDDLTIRKVEKRLKDIEDSHRETHRYFMERSDNQSKMYEHHSRCISSALGDIKRLQDEIKQMKNARKRRGEKP